MKRSSSDESLRMKMVVIGSESVGKTSLIKAYVPESPDSPVPIIPTVSIGCFQTMHEVAGRVVSLTICDTAGQERYQSVAPTFYRDANAAMAVFDVMSAPSLARVRVWLDELRATMPGDFLICVVANKIDLAHERPDERAVTTKEGKTLAAENSALYQETSALTKEGVDGAFGCLCEEFVRMERGREAQVVPVPHGVDLTAPDRPSDSCC
jgi:small GTP-binding protein